jgi:DNA-binding NarL/FixJ family response regulator
MSDSTAPVLFVYELQTRVIQVIVAAYRMIATNPHLNPPNRRTSVPDQAHVRIEFPRWLEAQTNRNRQIAETLALGHSTGEVARKLNLSPARVSQIGRELYDSWKELTG